MLQVLDIVVPVFAIVLVGFAYAQLRPADMDTANRLNVSLFSPALIFHALSEQVGDIGGLGSLALGAAVIVLGSGVLAWLPARLLGWQWRTVVPPAMFKNVGNMGLPLMVFAYGEGALSAAVTLFVTSTLIHFTLGAWLLSRGLNLLGLLRNPIVLATIAGIAAQALDWRAPEMLRPGIAMLADVAIPLMLVSLGVRLTDLDLNHWRIGLLGGLLAPLTGLAIAVPWILAAGLSGQQAGLLLLLAALPPAVLNYILAESFRQQPAEVAAIVAFGNLAALAVIPAVLAMLL
ncbi:AEC family transporter [Spiribacter halobius]|uniref:AEC family transporter n=1 Tax=Sediminicurvatus halobius TaxID=2182432 RepID=A0A2U2N9H5_9GAMM|nr:AEC family transporter [Spiribacter halobius]PWG65865.1 AEC family transporter [Spiribacter halobius]UEX77912.1 AEC family transporter [Spiribacter halobius]